MAFGKSVSSGRARRAVPRRASQQVRLVGEQLEPRFAPAGLPLTFTVPVDVANKGVYAAVFGNPTTSNTAAFVAGTDTSMVVGNSSFFPNSGSGSAVGEVTIADSAGSTVYRYTTNGSNTLSGLTRVKGLSGHTYAAGSVVSFAGPDINQAPFVYLGSPTAPDPQPSARTKPTSTVLPVMAGVLPVATVSGFAPSGSLKIYPPGQPDNSQTAKYSGISGNSFTGVSCSTGIGTAYVVEQLSNPSHTTTTTVSIGPSQPTEVPVNSVAGFPSSGTAIAFVGNNTIRFTYTGTSTAPAKFTGVYFLDNSAIPHDADPSKSATIVTPNALGSTVFVAKIDGFSGSGQLLVQSPAGLPTSPVQTSTNVVVSYTGTQGRSTFTGVSAFPAGDLPSLPSGGKVYQIPGPSSATAYLPLPTSGNLPLVSLFPNAGKISGTGTTSATLTLPDPNLTGILSGVIVLSVGSPVALPVTTKSVTNMGVSVSIPTVGSPTPATNGHDAFGIFEWGLTSKSLDFDVSEVDQAGFPLSVTTAGDKPPRPADPLNGVGMKQDRIALFEGFTTFIQNAAANYPPASAFLEGGADMPSLPTVPAGTRLTAPQDIIGNLLINPPIALNATPAGPPGTAGTNAYYWITAVNAGGESMASNFVQGTTTAVQSSLQVNWQPYPYASGYNVYWSSTSSLASAKRIASGVTSTSYTDDSPISHSSDTSGATVPSNNYLYDKLNSYSTASLIDFFAYYAAKGTTVCGVPGAGEAFRLDDQATKTKWTGHTQTGLTIGSTPGYTALVLTGEKGTWGSQFAGKTIWVVLPLFSSNTIDPSLGTLPPFPSNLASNKGESGTAMVFAGDGVFGAWSPGVASNFVAAGDSANLYNNVVSAFNRGMTPTRKADGTWSAVLPPTYWANSPLLQSVTSATTGGTLPAGSHRYWITAVDINGTTGNQTTFSNVVEATTTQGTASKGTNSVVVKWTAVNLTDVGGLYASSFNIYRSTLQANGTWTKPSYRANVINGPTTPTTTWTDTNATPKGTPDPLFNYYAPGTASNFYSAYFSKLDVSYNGLGYGFPYADKNGQSTNVQMAYPGGIKGLSVTLNPWPVKAPPSITSPIQFRVTPNQPGNLVWGPTSAPLSDIDSQRLTVTLAVSPADGGKLDAQAAGALIVTGQGTAHMTISGPTAVLNQYLKTAGRLTYTATGPSSTPRTLTITPSDGSHRGSSVTGAILVADPASVNPPTTNPSAILSGGNRGQWLVITYDQLVSATEAGPKTKSIEFLLNSVTKGTLQVWNGMEWVAPPSFGRFPVPMPLVGPGGMIRWQPPTNATGTVPAFATSLWDGRLKSAVICQVSIQVNT